MERPIQNCYWVEPGKLLAGEYPREPDHAPSLTKLRALRDAGVSAFIDLTEKVEAQAWGWVKPYDDMIDGASHERFPIADMGIPDSPALAIAALDAIDRHIEEGRTVYVHCFGGVGRTGVIVGCWLVRHGRTGDEALDRLAELWQDCPKSPLHPPSTQMPEQMDYIRNWPNPTPKGSAQPTT
ncbi:MAG: hypothetical protein F4Y96_06510 [Chloroflexi bacterium]|nr:hypothetical protein [Chloroflexota bacterium]